MGRVARVAADELSLPYCFSTCRFRLERSKGFAANVGHRLGSKVKEIGEMVHERWSNIPLGCRE